MKRYRVVASYITYCENEIEAESMDEAYQIAEQMEGGDFYYKGIDDWQISEVAEVV